MGSTTERQFCPEAAPLQSAAGLLLGPEDSRGRQVRQRELKGSLKWEDRGELTGGDIFTAFNTVSLWVQGNATAVPGRLS